MSPKAFWSDSLNHHAFAYLTTTGRRSGKPHRIEIWFAQEDNHIYLLSGSRDRADWVRNLMTNPDVTIELGGESFAGVASVLEAGTVPDQRCRELLVTKYQKNDELREWGRTSLGILIELDAGTAEG